MQPPPETPTPYELKICSVFRELCHKQGDGASPAEVTNEMHKRGWLSDMDTVIDIERIMQRLRRSGLL